ncbi:hypothetical protein ACVWYH_006248 [Bradyrhizobium sp. GM24.11]
MLQLRRTGHRRTLSIVLRSRRESRPKKARLLQLRPLAFSRRSIERVSCRLSKDGADQVLGSPDFRFAPRRTTNTDCSTSICQARRGRQISQAAEFKALRKPPKAISRQGSVPLAGFERWKMAVRLITVAFGFGLGRAAVATFFVSCRRRAIGLGGSDESMLTSSGGAMRSSTETASVGLSLLRAITSRRSAFANTPCELVPAFGSARGWTAATALCRGALNSIADSAPTPNRIRRPNNAVLSIMCLQSELVPLKILRSKKATCWRLPTRLGIICRQG